MTPDPALAALFLPLENAEFAIWLRTSLAYPLLETVHIIGLASLFGTLLSVELCLLGLVRVPGVKIATLAGRLLPLILLGFLLAATSGLGMFLARASELIANPFFFAKMLLVMAAGCNAAWLHYRGPLDASSLLTRCQAGLSLLIWLAVIVCGRWIAYV